jgi:ABC-type glycerol-3-phosphate transport system permease component
MTTAQSNEQELGFELALKAPVKPPPARRTTLSTGLVVRYLLLIVALIITIGPFLWELSTSLKSNSEDINTATPHFIPAHTTLSNFSQVARTIPVWHYMENSLFVAALCVAGNLVGATLAGYALSRLEFRGRTAVLGLFLSTLILPGEVTIISQFQTVNKLGFANSLIGVALPGMIGALNVLLMRNAFMAIPLDVDAAALIDGANVWQRLRYIGIPSVRGTLSVVAIFAFIGAWDDFLWPLLVLQSPDKLTLTVGLQYLESTFTNNPRTIAAGTMIALVPIVVFFACLQRYFFAGVGEGAVKG